MKIKICGLFRDADIEYVNEARPDYIGFVFAESRRKVTPSQAADLRRRLSAGITPVGVFVNAPVEEITALYYDGTIAIAQLHGTETAEYISRLKAASAMDGQPPIPVIKTIQSSELEKAAHPQSARAFSNSIPANGDYYLIDSGAGSGKTFDWGILASHFSLPASHFSLFLAGGISLDNIEQAFTLNPYALDISSGAETNGMKDRQKILDLVSIVRRQAVHE
jgi:phosphoribosylanthranilate isomerase